MPRNSLVLDFTLFMASELKTTLGLNRQVSIRLNLPKSGALFALFLVPLLHLLGDQLFSFNFCFRGVGKRFRLRLPFCADPAKTHAERVVLQRDFPKLSRCAANEFEAMPLFARWNRLRTGSSW